jgi:hypothetical protein
MYEEDKEPKSTDEIINEYNQQEAERKKQEELQRLETLRRMEENRKNQPMPEDKIKALSNVLGIDRINERLNELNESQNQVIGKLSETITALNRIVTQINGGVVQAPTSEGVDPMAKMELLTGLLDKAGQFYSIYKQNQNPPAPNSIIDPEIINEHLRDSMLSNFELGDALVKTLKNKVVGKALTKTISGIVNDDSNDPA